MATFPFDASLRDAIRQRLDEFEVAELPLAGRRAAAVVVTLVRDQAGEACFLLTRRASHLRNHGGQWSLPGGRVDGTETAEDAGLRELEEELGVARDGVEPLGRLDDFATRSGFVITPVVAWVDTEGGIEADPREVASVHRVPLAQLDRDDVPILHAIPESDRPVLSLPLLGQRVYAPTAAILYQLLEVAVRGNSVRVTHYEQPVFAWR